MKRFLLVLLAAAPSFTSENEITVENVLRVMNAYRAEQGIAPLRVDAKLARAAEGRMQDMIEGEWWDHQSPEGTSPFVWLAAANYDYLYAAENLAAGFDTAAVMVEAWMESPGHRRNLMSAQYADCGIAIIEGSTKGPAAGKSVVVLFGRQKVPLLAKQPE